MKYWGYLHSNGKVQVKAWFGDPADYTDDCYNNPFVVRVVPPLEAKTYEEAARIITELLVGGCEQH